MDSLEFYLDLRFSDIFIESSSYIMHCSLSRFTVHKHTMKNLVQFLLKEISLYGLHQEKGVFEHVQNAQIQIHTTIARSLIQTFALQ